MATNNLVVELEDPEPDSIWPYICDVCGEPIFNEGEIHDYHEPDCPNYGRLGCNVVECDCDGMAHPECCPECERMNKNALAENTTE